MKQFPNLLLSLTIWWIPAFGQETQKEVYDVVDLPASLTGQTVHSWVLAFRESWMVSPDRPGIQKTVNSYTVHDPLHPDSSPDSLQSVFGELIRDLCRNRPDGRLGEVSYEFMLMEPEMAPSNILIGPFYSLVSLHSTMASHYELKTQLRSLQFHETWFIDPASMEIKKKVHGITPVIWQRRETAEGEPVNDADTGLPVFFKIQLEYIPLRNP